MLPATYVLVDSPGIRKYDVTAERSSTSEMGDEHGRGLREYQK